MRKRVHQIKFRLDDDELMLLRRKLRESNLPMAEYFRRLLVYGEIKIYPNAFVADLQKHDEGRGHGAGDDIHLFGSRALHTFPARYRSKLCVKFPQRRRRSSSSLRG